VTGGHGFVPQLVEVDRNQGSAIVTVQARQAVALDDGARAFGRDVEVLADLRIGELFEHPAGHHPDGRAPLLLLVPAAGHQADPRVHAVMGS
jgi:hypothetical protein